MSTADLSSTPNPTAELLGLLEVRQQVHSLSVESYQRLGEQGLIKKKTELIRGVIVDKMSQSPLHCFLVQLLLKWLNRGLADGWTVRAANPITTHDSEPEPDVCVAPGGDEDYRSKHPTTAALVVEASLSSKNLDREKASIYAEAGVDEYWIVLAEQQAVEVHLKPEQGRYTVLKTLGVDDTLRPAALAGIELPIAKLFPPAG